MDKRVIGFALVGLFASSAAIAADAGLQSADGLNRGQPEATPQVPAKGEAQPEKGAGYGADADSYEYGFEQLDADQNGSISREEAASDQGLASNYDQADQNGNGKIDRSEFSAFTQQHAGQSSNSQSSGEQGEKPYGDVTNEKPADALGTDVLNK